MPYGWSIGSWSTSAPEACTRSKVALPESSAVVVASSRTDGGDAIRIFLPFDRRIVARGLAGWRDLLDAYSIHVFWDYWDTAKLEQRLNDVRAIVHVVSRSRRFASTTCALSS